MSKYDPTSSVSIGRRRGTYEPVAKHVDNRRIDAFIVK